MVLVYGKERFFLLTCLADLQFRKDFRDQCSILLWWNIFLFRMVEVSAYGEDDVIDSYQQSTECKCHVCIANNFSIK